MHVPSSMGLTAHWNGLPASTGGPFAFYSNPKGVPHLANKNECLTERIRQALPCCALPLPAGPRQALHGRAWRGRAVHCNAAYLSSRHPPADWFIASLYRLPSRRAVTVDHPLHDNEFAKRAFAGWPEVPKADSLAGGVDDLSQ